MNGHGWPATVFILGTFAGGSYRSPPLSGEHYGGNGELTLICNKFCVFSDLLSVDYGGFVTTLPDPSVASRIAIALRFAADAADWREDRRTVRSPENLCSASR